MTKRIILLIILFNFIISTTTFFLILKYFDPYGSTALAIGFLVITFVLALSSFINIVLYAFKKIYYRGDVGVYHVKSSFRQGIFISLFILGIIVFNTFGIPVFLSSILLGVLFGFSELFIQNLR